MGYHPPLKDTPYQIICHEHGQVMLTETEYNRQMRDPNALWKCPICHQTAEFDDSHFENKLEEEEETQEITCTDSSDNWRLASF